MIRTYSELKRVPTFEDRLEYLRIGGGVGQSTFGFDRYLNQQFYRSREWKDLRSYIIVRDQGCDLGVPGYEIHSDLHVHHMNPISVEDIIHHEKDILDPEFLILTTQRTHNAIHYGSTEELYPKVVTERSPRDTKLW